MLWSYNLVTGELSRVLTTPLSAEVTGSYRYDFNGFTYLWANMQHPSSSTSTGPEGYSGYFGTSDLTLDGRQGRAAAGLGGGRGAGRGQLL